MSETISFFILNLLHNSVNEMSNHFTRNLLASLNLKLILLLLIIFPNTCWDITCINMNIHIFCKCICFQCFVQNIIGAISLCVSILFLLNEGESVNKDTSSESHYYKLES
jgi:hypothetical protein